MGERKTTMKLDKEKQTLDATDVRYRELGKAILPNQLPPDFPEDFLHKEMTFQDTTHMTQVQKHKEFGHRALYSNLRAAAYEKTLATARKRTRVVMRLCWVFSLTWLALVLTINQGKFGEIFDKTMNMVPGAAQAKQAMQMQQQQMDAAEQQQRALQQQLQDMLK